MTIRIQTNAWFILLLHLHTGIAAQLPAIPDWETPDIRLDKSSGLTDLYIKDYLQDERGFMWIATHAAVQRFDGLTVQTFHLDKQDGDLLYVALEEDRQRNELWIAGLHALYRVDLGTLDLITMYYSGMADFWTGGYILCLYMDRNDRLWIGRNEGFSVINLETGEAYSRTLEHEHAGGTVLQFGRQVHSILQDPLSDDIFWFGTASGLVKYRTDSEDVTRFDAHDVNCTPISTVHNLYYCSDQQSIIHSNDTRTGQPVQCNFLVFDLQTEKYVSGISLSPEWKSRGIYPIDEDRLWLSTDHGTAIYSTVSGQVEEIVSSRTREFPARIDYIDNEGSFWSNGHNSLNIYRRGGSAVQSYYYETEFPKGYHVCSDVLVEADDVYMAVYGGDGVYVLNVPTGNWEILDPPPSEEEAPATFMGTGIERTLDGRIIALSNQGIYRITDRPRELEKIEELPGYGEGIIDRHGILWTYQNNALIRSHLIDGVLESFPLETADCVNRRRAFRPRLDQHGNLWFFGICDGFIHYIDSEKRFVHSRNLSLASEMDGYVVDVVVIDSLAYVITESFRIGVIDLSKNTYDYTEITNLIPLLPEDVALLPTRAMSDPEGKIWILSSAGLIRYDPSSHHVRIHGEADGVVLRDRELAVFSAEQMQFIDDTRLVYSTRKGLHIVDTELLHTSATLPEAYIATFLVHNSKYMSDSSALNKQRYHLRSRENYLTFEFSAIGYDHPEATEFAHMLVGVDEDWVISNRKNVTYSYLQGGDYRLQLKARVRDGEWGPVFGAAINIQKKWHEMFGMRLLLVLLAGGLGYLIYRSRVKRAIDEQRLKMEYERELAEVKINALTAQMNPHFIFNSLNSIDYYIIKNDSRRASDYLNRFARLIRLILNHSRSNYISLREDLEALRLYIEIESLRFDERFNYTVQADGNIDLENVRIPPMLFQPYVENAIWHGLMHKKEKGCICVKVRMAPEGQSLHCTIEDNGIGRKRAAELRSKSASHKSQKSMGMTINQDKIDLINHLHNIHATVDIEDLYNDDGDPAGTRVTLIIPI